MDKIVKMQYDDLYSNNPRWKQNESYSGPGSDLQHTDKLIEQLPVFIKKYNIRSIVDVPCGDFNYMKHINLEAINYKGYDVSPNCISMCDKFKQNNISFSVLDITKDTIPCADLVIIKDLFLHLSFKHISLVLSNVLKSKPKYLAVSHYPQRVANIDMKTGIGCRPIDVFIKPFNLTYPVVERIIYSEKYNGDELVFLRCN